MFFNRNRMVALLLAGMIAILMAGCAPEAEAPPPTRTPAPTFTPVSIPEPAPVDPAALATAQAAAPIIPVAPVTDPVAGSDTGAQPVGGDAAPVTDTTAAQPTVAPTVAVEVKAQLSPTTQVNVRQGPSTAYAVLGQANPGETYDVTGKNPAGDWWQIAYNGQSGWVIGELATATNTTNVAVAQNIPVAPTPAPVVVVPATAVPAPPPAAPEQPAEPAPEEPAPTQAPASNMKFNVAVVGSCLRQPAGNWFAGTTYINGAPTSGYKVVFSGGGPDGEWATPPVQSGPHAGYEGWDAGYYSHIINASGPQAGTWYVWVVDDAGARISEIASWTSTGPGEDCNEAIVSFDSR